MCTELHTTEEGTTAWTTAPVWVTFLPTGYDEGELDPHIIRLAAPMMTPNGHLIFLGLLKGLPVVRFNTDRNKGVLLLRTRDGNVLRLTPYRLPVAPKLMGNPFAETEPEKAYGRD